MANDLSIATKVGLLTSRMFAGLSFFACICTALEAVMDWRLGKDSIVTRIQAVMQAPIIMYSIALIFGTSLSSEGWLGFGSAATCSAQGFAILLAVSTGLLLDMAISL